MVLKRLREIRDTVWGKGFAERGKRRGSVRPCITDLIELVCRDVAAIRYDSVKQLAQLNDETLKGLEVVSERVRRRGARGFLSICHLHSVNRADDGRGKGATDCDETSWCALSIPPRLRRTLSR